MLRILNLEAGYGKLRVLKGVSLHVSRGEVVTILGANGAGKTTLLSAIAGVIKPWDGEILFDGQRIEKAPAEKIVSMGCSLVPEGRQVFGPLTVKENLVLGGYARRGRTQDASARSFLAGVYELFEVLREREFTLLFHEGRESNLHVVQVTDQILMLLTFGHETQVGLVRLYTTRALEVLKPIFEHAEDTEDELVDQSFSLEAGTALDDLFPEQSPQG